MDGSARKLVQARDLIEALRAADSIHESHQHFDQALITLIAAYQRIRGDALRHARSRSGPAGLEATAFWKSMDRTLLEKDPLMKWIKIARNGGAHMEAPQGLGTPGFVEDVVVWEKEFPGETVSLQADGLWYVRHSGTPFETRRRPRQSFVGGFEKRPLDAPASHMGISVEGLTVEDLLSVAHATLVDLWQAHAPKSA